jgi:hypothetical protein
MATPSSSRALDVAGMESRMDEIRLKQMLGGTLSDQELMCLQFEQNGFGCGSCSSPGYLVDTRGADPSWPAEP